MHYLFKMLFFILLTCAACTKSTFNSSPTSKGPDFSEKDTMLVAWFAHYDPEFSDSATVSMVNAFSECNGLQVVSPGKTMDYLQKSFIQLSIEMEFTEEELRNLYRVSGVKYLFTGQFVGKNGHNNFMEPIPSAPDQRWVYYRFKIYNLEHQELAFMLNGKFEASHYDFDPDKKNGLFNFRFYSSGVNGLPKKAVRKSLKQLKEKCGC